MKEKEFDSLIRTRLKDHESPVPTDMWERITLNGKKRKGGFAPRLYLLTIVFLLIGFGGVFYSSYFCDQPQKNPGTSKINTTESISKKTLVRSNNKEDHSVHNLNVANHEDPGVIDNITGNHVVKNLFEKTRKRKKDLSQNQGTFKVADDVMNDSKQSSDGTGDNPSGSVIKKPVEKTNEVKSDPAENAGKPQVESGYDKFSLELFTSPSVPINSVSSDNKAYEQALKKSSTMQLSYTIGARISYSISKRLSAKTGVQYSQVNEKMSFTDSAGNYSTSGNRYKNIGVPLVLGYKMVSVNKLDVYVNTGIILNVASKYKGMIPSTSGQPIDIKNENVYTTNASADLYFGINLSKKVNSRTDFFAEPWLNYRFKNMVSHYYSFDQKINTLGVSLGLRYRLYKIETSR
jgi:opacity protein-like surface antigen